MTHTRRDRASEAGRPCAPPSRRPATLATALAALPALAVYPWPALVEWLQFDRARIAGGEVWRVVSCHWTHFSTSHLLWDLSAFCVLLFLSWRENATRTLATLTTSCVLIPAAIWIALPDMSLYRGLSGIDSALFAFLALSLFRRERAAGYRLLSSLAVLTLAGFAAKIVFEMATGATVFADSSHFVPVPLAHAVGAACGAVLAVAPTRPGEHDEPRRPCNRDRFHPV